MKNLAAMDCRGTRVEAMLKLREEERQTRLSLMRSLIAIGDDLSNIPSLDNSSMLRSTWLTVVNSVLAMDQATNLAPLMEHSPEHKPCIMHFKSVSASLRYIIMVGSLMWASAKLDDRGAIILKGNGFRDTFMRSSNRLESEDEGGLGVGGEGQAQSSGGGDPDGDGSTMWKIYLDNFSPPAATISPKLSVSIEVDTDEALGTMTSAVCNIQTQI